MKHPHRAAKRHHRGQYGDERDQSVRIDVNNAISKLQKAESDVTASMQAKQQADAAKQAQEEAQQKADQEAQQKSQDESNNSDNNNGGDNSTSTDGTDGSHN